MSDISNAHISRKNPSPLMLLNVYDNAFQNMILAFHKQFVHFTMRRITWRATAVSPALRAKNNNLGPKTVG
jgi:hypothetical protein